MSCCVEVSRITRTVYMLPLIRSKWPGWETYQQMDRGWCAQLFISAVRNKQYIHLSGRCVRVTWTICIIYQQLATKQHKAKAVTKAIGEVSVNT